MACRARADGAFLNARAALRHRDRLRSHPHGAPVERPFRLSATSGDYTCDALIIATGASARYLGLRAKRRFRQGRLRVRDLRRLLLQGSGRVVVGGGNTAVEEALYLSNIARIVHARASRDKFAAEAIMIDKLMAKTAQRRQHQGALESRLDEVLGDTAASPARGSPTSSPARCATVRVTASSSRSATRRIPRSSKGSSR
jgi:thioredoxin reductase (NADPH)